QGGKAVTASQSTVWLDVLLDPTGGGMDQKRHGRGQDLIRCNWLGCLDPRHQKRYHQMSRYPSTKAFTLSIWLIFGFRLHAAASVGAVIGFDGEEHIFIQPYWRGAKLRCVIANLRNEPAKISVHLEGPENTAGKQIQKAWVLAAHCVQDVDGSKLDQAKGLLWIRLNDQFDLGTLPIGKAPDLETKDAIVTTYGLNGSTDWVWASQN